MATFSVAKTIPSLIRGTRNLIVVGSAQHFGGRKAPKLFAKKLQDLVADLAKEAKPGELGGTATSLFGKDPRRVTVGILPKTYSRHNCAARPHAVHNVVARGGISSEGKGAILLVLDDPQHLRATLHAVGRAFPKYSQRSSPVKETKVQVHAVDCNGKMIEIDDAALFSMEATRDAAELVDTPPCELTPETFAKRAKEMLKGIRSVSVTEITGNKLVSEGLLGIHSVGRCAPVAPRMLVARYNPKKGSGKHIALVGKGITYDTGGLNLKIQGHMSGMKCDMGGAAAVLGAFRVLIAEECKHQLTLILCLAENSIGPDAYRPDDIVRMHSGKTVEINNTDAEGRLLLADGVSYASRDCDADIVFDAATLTGAQLVSTGVRHAAIVSNDDELEATVLAAGKVSGDLAHPLLFAPEFFQAEFKSTVADMRNSVENRMNAQSSCAAQFVYTHMDSTRSKWCHIDLAGPSFSKGRGSGYGVGLISQAVRGIE